MARDIQNNIAEKQRSPIRWLSVVATAFFLTVCFYQPRGSIIGNAMVKAAAIHIGFKSLDRPERVINFNNTKVFLLKYKDDLPREGEVLVKEHAKVTYEKAFQAVKDTVIAKGGRKKSAAIVDDLIEDQRPRNDELERKISLLIFPHIVQQTLTDEKGNFKFRDIPYSKYLIHIHEQGYTWFVPVNLESKEWILILNESNCIHVD